MFTYPEARRDLNVKEVHFGIEIPDPYRWLENPESDETKKFVDEQNLISIPYLKDHPDYDSILEKVTEMWNFPKFDCPYRAGDNYFFKMNSGLQNQSVMYKLESLEGNPTVFLDLNDLAEDGTVSFAEIFFYRFQTLISFSNDGKTMGYGLSEKGSDWITFHFKDTLTSEDYPEKLKNAKFSSLSWSHDSKGVFYGIFPDPNNTSDGQKVYYHKLGTPQDEDILCVEFPQSGYLLPTWISSCGRWLMISPRESCKYNQLYFADLQALPDGINGKIQLTEVVTIFEADYEYVTNSGSKFVFRTNKDAPNYKLIVIDFNNCGAENWETLVTENKKDVLEWAICAASDKLVLCYNHDVKNILRVHNLSDGSFIQEIPLEMGTVMGFSGNKKHSEFFYGFKSFFEPGKIYHCDLNQTPIPPPTIFRESKIDSLDADEYEVEQVFYSSKDGTKVPMFITYKKGLKKDGNNPCLLFGYGGFNYSIMPEFQPMRTVLMKHFNFVFAVSNIRGGGEYGEKWYNGGILLNKQNSFDDFHGGAEYLIQNGYTKKDLLAIQGISNGGLLVASCINQRPDLYGAALIMVGLLDMPRFIELPIGSMLISEFGNPEKESDFKYMFKYSPLHNLSIKKDQFPPILVLTADHDERVAPSHSLKYIATLQNLVKNDPKQENPLILKVDKNCGHFNGKPSKKQIEECVDIICFLLKTLKLKNAE